MNHRVIVLPVVSSRGLYSGAFGAGVVHGLLGCWLIALIFGVLGQLLLQAWSTWGGVLLVTLTLNAFAWPSAFFAALVSRCFAKIRLVAFAGTVFGLGSGLGVAIVFAWRSPDTLFSGSVIGNVYTKELSPLIGFLAVPPVLLALVCAAIFSIVHVVRMCFGARSVFQTGRLCWHCGYDVGVGCGSVCSECGQGFEPEQEPKRIWLRVFQRFLRHGRVVGLVCFVIGCAIPAMVIRGRALAELRFIRACPREATSRSLMFLESPPWLGAQASFSDVVWWYPDRVDPSLGVAIVYRPSVLAGSQRMLVVRADSKDMVGLSAIEFGTIRVQASLSSAQANELISSRRVPVELLEAVRKAANHAGWQSTSASGAISLQPDSPRIEVDPASFLTARAH